MHNAYFRLVIAFNIERYICVCHPLRARDFCNKRVSRFVVIGSLLSGVLLSLQFPISYRKDSCFNVVTNHTYFLLKMSSSIALRTYYKFMDYTNMVLFNFIPVLVLLILNSSLIQTLRRVITRDFTYSNSLNNVNSLGPRKRSRPSLTSAQIRASWSANAILFAVVLMFMFCLGPQIPARILFEIYGARSDLVLSYMAVSQQLIFLNASLNFCLFCLVSKRYRNLMRRTLKQLCGISQKVEKLRKFLHFRCKYPRKSGQRQIVESTPIIVAPPETGSSRRVVIGHDEFRANQRDLSEFFNEENRSLIHPMLTKV